MASSVLDKSKFIGSFGLEALNKTTARKRLTQNLKTVLGFNSVHHGPEFNTAARNKVRTVQSFYNQSAIDIAAAKVT